MRNLMLTFAIVGWNDACGDEGDIVPLETLQIKKSYSSGYIIEETKEKIVLAGSYFPKEDNDFVDTVRNRLAISKKMVRFILKVNINE